MHFRAYLLVVGSYAVLRVALHGVQQGEEAQQRVAVTWRQQVEEVLEVLQLV